jgi:hypothetical protein
MGKAQIAGGLAALLAAALLGGAWLARAPSAPQPAGAAPEVPAAPEAPAPLFALPPGSAPYEAAPGIATWYEDDALPFSFEVPEGFTARSYPTSVPGGEAVVVADASGEGMLLVAAPAAAPHAALAPADVLGQAPGLSIASSTSVEAAPGVEGLAFEAEDPLWGAAAAEFWFVYRGEWYEFSTFAKDAGLINFIWGSWLWR